MSEPLWHYYNQELRFIRREAEEFAQQYPDVAARLQLTQFKSLDPHVERLIEAFALLTGRIRAKLDDEFPELSEALLHVLYPHYLAPVPSLGVVQFDADATRGELSQGHELEPLTGLHTAPLGYDPDDRGKRLECNYRTCYPVRLWPVRLAEARLLPGPFGDLLGEHKPPAGTKAALRLVLQCEGEASFSTLPKLDKLRFYLAGDSALVGRLYELLFNNAIEALFRAPDGQGATARLMRDKRDFLSPVGFGRDEGLLPYPPQSFLGYRLLTEFFAFPQKFFFVDLGGFNAKEVRDVGFGRALEVVLFLNQADAALAKAVTTETFRLGCTPIVNLFKRSVALELKPLHYEYPLVPDAAHRRALEVYSVDAVTLDDPAARRNVTYHPFYSLRHGSARDGDGAYWYATRRPSVVRDDAGTEVALSLVDLKFDPRLPTTPRLHVDMTCTNRDLARLLREAGDLKMVLEGAAPLRGDPHCVAPPTLPRRPPLRRGTYWRLLSHLNLNHLSLASVYPEQGEASDGDEGRQALQEILRLYDYTPEGGSGPTPTQQLIEALLSLRSRRVVRRTGARTSSGFAQGIEVTAEFDRDGCHSTGVYLYASVLERFLGLYASINSFSQLTARVTSKASQEQGTRLKTWPPRAGEQQLL